MTGEFLRNLSLILAWEEVFGYSPCDSISIETGIRVQQILEKLLSSRQFSGNRKIGVDFDLI